MSAEPMAAKGAVEAVSAKPLNEAIHSGEAEELLAAAGDAALGEDLALTLLRRRDLPAQALERLSKNAGAMKYRRVKQGLVEHGKTPRHVAMIVLRQLFTFDLMQVALAPAVAADIKVAADEALIQRLETVPTGARISLAHCASAGVAGALLRDGEPRVIEAALENPRLTEAAIFKAVTRGSASRALVMAVCGHPKWSLRREVRAALLRSEHTPADRAVEFAGSLPAGLVREILQVSRLPEGVKGLVEAGLGGR